ncbi:PTS IIA-like nitrogen regulatory protein PtsN [Aliikangiella sp. G2MR2-5]|uniref:PTS IIA-like nitrogen regulatory protein PtsN n=1 Tax=Aliikangiella sp. G2MR2-5 TaxID=2788943 RepID=UPI0018AC0B05|nr:PTS IIA-like nitrogen regulatory protein PtsN [Aliikangiella sp. G2MR2-5]
MKISQILSPEATFCSVSISSKKKILEKVSEEMSKSIDCPAQDIFESLFARERLGTTGLGEGIAIPHGRITACEKATAVFLLLDEAIDYDAPDGKPVDIIFAILVPENANSEQLKFLAEIAEVLSQPNVVSQIRHAHCGDALFQIIDQATQRLH